MNNFGDKVKHFFGLEFEEEEFDNDSRELRVERRRYDYDDIPDETEAEAVKETSRERRVQSSSARRSYPEKATQERTALPVNENKVVICKYSPLDHRESTAIIDDIRAGRPVILNFEDTDDFVAAKIINICEGAAYALDADISKIANEIFIVVPSGIDIMNNINHPEEASEDISF